MSEGLNPRVMACQRSRSFEGRNRSDRRRQHQVGLGLAVHQYEIEKHFVPESALLTQLECIHGCFMASSDSLRAMPLNLKIVDEFATEVLAQSVQPQTVFPRTDPLQRMIRTVAGRNNLAAATCVPALASRILSLNHKERDRFADQASSAATPLNLYLFHVR
jgi:hypothetical protein